MRRTSLVLLGVVLALVIGIMPAGASQIPVLTDAGTHGYGWPNCPQTTTQDTISITNIAATESLSGYIQTEQVVPASTTYPDGRRVLQKYSESWNGLSNFSQVVTHPPFNDPTVLANAIPQPDGTSTIEFHVDIAISVLDGGNFVITLGPGQDYHVYCIGAPPPPPPPPPASLATRTLGYWKTHTTSWPNATIQLGSATYSTSNPTDKAYLISIMKEANAKDVTYMVAAQLIAAELNYASGGPQTATSTINAANAYLTQHTIGSNPQKAAKVQGSSLSQALDLYNQSQDFG